MELKTYALLSAFILVNTLSDCNLQGSCLSQTSSSAPPPKIPIKTSVLVANGRGEGTSEHQEELQEMAKGRAGLLLDV